MEEKTNVAPSGHAVVTPHVAPSGLAAVSAHTQSSHRQKNLDIFVNNHKVLNSKVGNINSFTTKNSNSTQLSKGNIKVTKVHGKYRLSVLRVKAGYKVRSISFKVLRNGNLDVRVNISKLNKLIVRTNFNHGKTLENHNIGFLDLIKKSMLDMINTLKVKL